MITCCKDCTERHINCHSTCQKYLKANEEHQLILSKQRKEKEIKDFCRDVSKRTVNIFYSQKKKNINRYIPK